MPKALKVTLITLLSAILAGCATIIVWYVSVCLLGKEKVLSKTFYVGGLTLADGTTENIVEVEYFANKDNSGYEAFEIKYTYFMDETKENSYSQGFQYIADAGTSINFGYAHDNIFKTFSSSTGALGWKKKYYNCQNSNVPTSNVSTYNYMSNGDEYILSTNPIDEDSYFKIQIGEELYLMQFKHKDTPMSNNTYIGQKNVYHNVFTSDEFHNMYFVYDAHYFSRLLYESVKSANLGTNQEIVFEFGNLFNYYEYLEEDGQYSEEKTNYDKTVKLEADIKSYFSIRVKTHENGLTCSDESMFGSVLGNQNFSLNGDYSSGDYFIGKTIIDCDISAFDFVTVEDNNVALKLSDRFIDYYDKYKSTIALSIVIDLDLMESLGYNFVGFTSDNNLDKFSIYECYSISAGEKVQDYIDSLEVVYV